MENEIDWSNVPKWVRYVAQDEDGSWWWYEHEPRILHGNDWWTAAAKDKKAGLASQPIPTWKTSLRKRPNK